MTDVEPNILIPAGTLVAVLGWAVSRLLTKVDEAIEAIRDDCDEAVKTTQRHEIRLALLEAGEARAIRERRTEVK